MNVRIHMWQNISTITEENSSYYYEKEYHWSHNYKICRQINSYFLFVMAMYSMVSCSSNELCSKFSKLDNSFQVCHFPVLKSSRTNLAWFSLSHVIAYPKRRIKNSDEYEKYSYWCVPEMIAWIRNLMLLIWILYWSTMQLLFSTWWRYVEARPYGIAFQEMAIRTND